MLFIVPLVILPAINGWLLSGNTETTNSCPERESASPYYFGTTDLTCMLEWGKRKREVPSRVQWIWTHRFIYYKGYYFEFGSNDVHIGTNRSYNHCPGAVESTPAGYSTLSVDCIKKCALSYPCHFGNYSILSNNCHMFANQLSRTLCTWTKCPSSCNEVYC